MAVEEFWTYYEPTKTVYFAIWRPLDGYIWDQDSSTFVPEGDAVSPFIASLERLSPGGSAQSMYVTSINLSNVYNAENPEEFAVLAYDQTLIMPSFTVDLAVAQREIRVSQGELVGGAAVGSGDNCCYGNGEILVDQDYPCKGDLCFTDPNGNPIDNVIINIFRKEDWDAGNRGNSYIVASTRTDAFGNWTPPVMLDVGEYVIQAYKQGEFGPNHYPLTVYESVAP